MVLFSVFLLVSSLKVAFFQHTTAFLPSGYIPADKVPLFYLKNTGVSLDQERWRFEGVLSGKNAGVLSFETAEKCFTEQATLKE